MSDQDSENDDQEREQGFLSSADRAFLRGEKEYESKRGRRKRQEAIRSRTRNAFQDFALVFEHMEIDQRIQILNQFVHRTDHFQALASGERLPPGAPETEWDIFTPEMLGEPVYTGGMLHTQATIGLLLYELFVEQFDANLEQYEGVMEQFVSQGLRDVFGKKGLPCHADVGIQFQPVEADADELREKLESDPESLTPEEVGHLIDLREISYEEMIEYADSIDTSED